MSSQAETNGNGRTRSAPLTISTAASGKIVNGPAGNSVPISESGDGKALHARAFADIFLDCFAGDHQADDRRSGTQGDFWQDREKSQKSSARICCETVMPSRKVTQIIEPSERVATTRKPQSRGFL